MENMKKKAFTLAEVLITVVIIGVVASLTIPTVITNYKSKALETQRKKVESVLANGFRMLMAKDNVTSLKDTKFASCNRDKACYTSEITKVFNVALDNNSNDDIFKTEYRYLGGGGEYNIWNLRHNFPYSFITSDGVIFGIDPGSYNTSHRITIVVDVNGVKNPNKEREDLYVYQITDEGKILYDDTLNLYQYVTVK